MPRLLCGAHALQLEREEAVDACGGVRNRLVRSAVRGIGGAGDAITSSEIAGLFRQSHIDEGRVVNRAPM